MRGAWPVLAPLAIVSGAARVDAQADTTRPIARGTIAVAARADRVVVTRADLERSGWSRVSEALWESGWALSSLDGYSFGASPDGLPPTRLNGAGSPTWSVLVDGQPVPVRAAGVLLLEALPVSIAQVESVTVTRLPTLAAGRVALRGVLQVYTRRATRPALRALYAIGNERGDPGPYRYTPLASPNVERLGPDATAAAFAGGARGDVQASARYSTLNLTDATLLARIDTTAATQGRNLYQQLQSVAGRAGAYAGGGWHGVLAGATRLTGLLYEPGHEDWARVTLAHAGAAGSLAARTTALRYSATFTRLDADTLAPGARAPLAHARSTIDARLEGTWLRGATELAVGGGAARWSLERGPSSLARTQATAFVRASHARARWAGEATAAGVHTDAGLAAQLLASLRVDAARGALVLAAGGGAQAEDQDDEWTEREVARDGTIAVAATPTLAFADASWGRTLANGTGIELGAGVTRVSDWRLRTLDVSAVHEASVFGARVALHAPLATWGTADLRWRLSAPNAEDAMAEALAAVPRQLGRLRVSTVEWQHLRATAGVTWQSRTTWPAALDSLGDGRTLPALARLDASVEKWFWHRRARGYVAARNLLDREERYHPAGADFALRVFLGADVELP